MKKKGFTMIEVLIALVLVSTAIMFFTSVFVSSYKLTTKSRNDTEVAFAGQSQMEEAIVEKVNLADTEDRSSITDPSYIKDVNIWGKKVEGFSIKEEIASNKTDAQGKPIESARGMVIGFVYATKRTPDFSELRPIYLKKSGSNTTIDHTKVIPKFMYLEEILDSSATLSKEYEFGFIIEDPLLMRRTMQREYFGQSVFEDGARKYVARPYSSFIVYLDESTDKINKIDEPIAPIYNSYFPRGYETIDSRGTNIYEGGDPSTQANLPLKDKITSSIHFPVSIPKGAKPDEIYDIVERSKDDFRDKNYLRTLQVQTVSGYALNEVVMTDAMTWLIGTPVVDNLAAQWDANLIFPKHDVVINPKSVDEKTASPETVERLDSFRSNIDLNSTDVSKIVSWDDLRTLQGNKSASKRKLNYIGIPKLMVRETDNADSEYRRFSAGIRLQPTATNDLGRLKITDKTDSTNPSDMLSKGFGVLGKGHESYTIIIRAKQIDPSVRSNIFSINMDNLGVIKNTEKRNYEAAQFAIDPTSGLMYKYDSGSGTPDARRYFTGASAALHASLYTPMDSNDERAGYHIYELRLEHPTGTPNDQYKMSLLVDGKKIYDPLAGQMVWSDLRLFGLDIGTNLEVSDILMYDKILSDDESQNMAKYLLKKYTISKDERDQIDIRWNAL